MARRQSVIVAGQTRSGVRTGVCSYCGYLSLSIYRVGLLQWPHWSKSLALPIGHQPNYSLKVVGASFLQVTVPTEQCTRNTAGRHTAPLDSCVVSDNAGVM